MKKKIFLLGHPLSHSYSPLIHSCLADYAYSLADIPENELGRFVAEQSWDGLNVTVPYKKEIIKYLDGLSPEAQRIGSVNTVIKEGGKLIGYNTDYYGFKYLIDSVGFNFAEKKILILGSGGSSLTVRTVAQDMNALETVVISRSGKNNYTNISNHYDSDYIVNTTPVGMFPECAKALVDITKFKKLKGVIDLIYNPAKTALILDAEENGIPAVSGLAMLVAQAKKASELFLPDNDSTVSVADIVKKVEKEKKSIILIGMPGCGKTTVGKIIAEMTGRKFYDTDSLITEKTGFSPETIIQNYGTEFFRKTEHEILSEVSKQSSAVISTGGGIVTFKDNIRLLHRNAYVVFIRRDINTLTTEGRPISASTGLEKLWAERKDMYISAADITVDSCEKPEDTADRILKGLCL